MCVCVCVCGAVAACLQGRGQSLGSATVVLCPPQALAEQRWWRGEAAGVSPTRRARSETEGRFGHRARREVEVQVEGQAASASRLETRWHGSMCEHPGCLARGLLTLPDL